MPYTVNGIGTTYYGKKNKDEHFGVCPQCNQRAALLDYDTRHWFVIFFVPIIPLGQRRILNQCSLCSAHQVAKLHQWEEGSQAALKEGMDLLKQNPESPEAMVQAHATFAQTGKREEALKLATLMREKFPEDIDIHLFLVSWYESVGMNNEVNACLEQAYKIDPENPFACRGMALTYIERKEPDKAKPLLEKFKPGTELYEPALFVHLANAYQANGDHEEAAKIHEMILESNPEASMDKEFRKSVKQSSQALGTTAPAMQTPPLYKHPVVGWGGLITAVLLGFICWTFYLKSNRTVYVVNGMSVPITFKIDGGETQEVPALSRIETTVAEGEHQVELLTPEIAITPPDNFEIKGGFFDRIFDESVTVLDPSESAIVQKAYNFYAEHPERHQNIALPDDVYQVCKPVTFFPQIDYIFEDFPEEHTIPDGKNIVTKSGLIFIPVSEEQLGILFLILPHKNHTFSYSKRHLKLDGPSDELISNYTASSITPKQLQECKQSLQELLTKEPQKVSYHHSLMSIGSQLKNEDELIEYYDKLITDNPDNATFHYLRGLLFTKISETENHWNKTLEIDPHNPELLLGLASLAYSQKNYEQALLHLKEIFNTGNEDQLETATKMKLNCLFQLDRIDEITQITADKQNEHWRFLLKFHTLNGEPEKAKAVIKQYLEQLEQEAPGSGRGFESVANFYLAYFQQQYAEALTNYNNSVLSRHDSLVKLELELLNQKQSDAMHTYGKLDPETQETCCFLMSLAYLLEDNNTDANMWLDRGIQNLINGTRTERQGAELFLNDQASWEELVDLNYQGRNRLILFTVFALKHDHLRNQIKEHLSDYGISFSNGDQLATKLLESDRQFTNETVSSEEAVPSEE